MSDRIEAGDLVRVKLGSGWVSPHKRIVEITERNGPFVKIAECVWWLHAWRFELVQKADRFTLTEINA